MRRTATISVLAATLAVCAPAAGASAGGGASAPASETTGTVSSGGAMYGSAVAPYKRAGTPRPSTKRKRAAKRHRAAAKRRRAAARKRTKGKRGGATYKRPPASEPPVPTPTPTSDHAFPVKGPFSFGGKDSRFGAGRPGHVHQGQDISAALGTPVVAPWPSTVEAVKYQAGGAGYYVVLDGDGEDRDYVFMHLRKGSTFVKVGDSVAKGQQIAQVGSTGSSSGPHLHFEIWVGGGWYTGGEPVDPLPFLQAWL
jgi:murein DD-endopeptidase MepM/ murein hydrolase activator NlpD